MLDDLLNIISATNNKAFTTIDIQDMIDENSPCLIPNLVYEARQCVNDKCCCYVCAYWEKEMKKCTNPNWDVRRRVV